jgi:hypothetical protein
MQGDYYPFRSSRARPGQAKAQAEKNEREPGPRQEIDKLSRSGSATVVVQRNFEHVQ